MPEDPPARLDLALDWLQRSLEELAEATRRTAAAQGGAPVATGTPPPPPGAPVTATLPAVRPAAGGPGSATTAPPPGADATATPAAPDSAASPTPLLDQLGRDLVALAAAGKLSPIVGRTRELDWLVEILCRSTKRNAALLGPAGSGKTAIVEGLAQRIAAGKVPAPLQGVRLIEIPLAGLVAGTQYRGQLEERLAQLVKEASQPGIILFFDEVHLLAGAGGAEGGIGADETLKPALSRGDIAVIGATTPEEWRATIAKDSALARRFTTVTVSELDKAGTRPILRAIRDSLARKRGLRVSDSALDTLLEYADARIANRRFPDKAIDLLEQAVAAAVVAGRTRVDRADAVRTTAAWAARATATPTLERFGRDLVALAGEGRLGPIVGRDAEIEAMTEILLRHSKRNPLLVGPAGSGKTAIVEGFAIRLAGPKAPPRLKGVHVFDIALLPLAAACAREPELLGDFLLEARHPSVIVFFDEVHQLLSPAVHDLAESLKPVLSRGEIACIGATTGEEYQATIERDPALDRRFTLVPIEPMDATAVRTVLLAVRDNLARLRGVTVDDAALDSLIDLADDLLPNRSFPDKGVDMLEQAVAYALAHGLTTVDTVAARAAATAIAGTSLDATERLDALTARLAELGLLAPASTDALTRRLGVTLRGLDSVRARPQAVVLLAGAAADALGPLADAMARTIYGRATARIDIDLAGLTEDASISTLLGSAPGLVGSDRPLPLAELRRSPRAVVTFAGIDRCAPSIREAIGAGLGTGAMTDAMGRSLPLGGAVILLSAPDMADAGATDAAVLGRLLGQRLVDAVDVVATERGAASGDGSSWVRERLVAPLADRLRGAGWDVHFSAPFVDWLTAQLPADGRAPEAYVDRSVTPLVVAALQATTAPAEIDVVDGRVIARPPKADGYHRHDA